MTEKKRILLVSNGFYPEISPRSFRTTELAKEFVRKGHDVTVISKHRDNDYTALLNEYPLTFKMWSKPHFPAVPSFSGRIGNLITRIASRIMQLTFEYPGIEEMFKVKKVLKNEKDYDLLISFAVPYPVHWGTAWARTKKNPIASTWIADCGDPYMGGIMDTFRKPFYFGFIEKWFMRKTNFITVPISNAKNAYYKEFQDKIRIIPQGFDFGSIPIPHIEVKNAIPKFAYAGSLAPKVRDPRPLLDYLNSVPNEFRFIVYTNQKELLSGYMERMTDKLELRDYIPRTQLLKELSQMDFLVNFDNNNDIQSPSKLIDYLLAGRPVLNIKKDFNKLIINQFLAGDYSGKYFIENLDKYRIENVASQFLNLVKD